MSNDAAHPESRSDGTERELRGLVELVARLRAPDGCPWDRRQSHASLKGTLIEEAYEAVAAIDADDPDALAEELGDLLLHVAFHVQIAREADEFDSEDVFDGIVDKIVRRHPHVFGEVEQDDEAAVNEQWERLKRRDKRSGRSTDGDAALPALIAARKRLDKRSHLGQPSGLGPTDQQLADLLAERLDGADASAELGEMLFQIVDHARERGLEPEICLRRALTRLDDEEQP